LKLKDLLRKEVDKLEVSEVFGLSCDSDEEEIEDGTDDEYFSDSEVNRSVMDYDIDKMFEIIQKRDFEKWSLGHIHNRYKKVKTGETGRKQLSR